MTILGRATAGKQAGQGKTSQYAGQFLKLHTPQTMTGKRINPFKTGTKPWVSFELLANAKNSGMTYEDYTAKGGLRRVIPDCVKRGQMTLHEKEAHAPQDVIVEPIPAA